MRRVLRGNLEFAWIADGVRLEEVYSALDTPEGLERAFRKLDTIKDEVIWWEVGAQPPQMLADGEVVMSTAYNGRIFNAQVLEGEPFVIVWDGQLLAVGQVGIVRGTPRLGAQSYVGFATGTESLARISRRISYSPTRRSAVPLVTTHVPTGVEMEPHMPAHSANAARALIYGLVFLGRPPGWAERTVQHLARDAIRRGPAGTSPSGSPGFPCGSADGCCRVLRCGRFIPTRVGTS